jgi:uncharacterized protein YdeI (YjbR/CyaY-like superfamily)
MPAAAKTPAVPADIMAGLDANSDAASHFAALPPSHKAAYLTWIAEAKKPDTRARRIAGMIDRLRADQTQPA